MKILKYLLIAIGVLAIIFFGKGLMTPSVEYDCEVTVNKSAQEAWAVMSDESTLDQWISGYKKTELVSGPANTVGAVSNVYVEDSGQEMMMTETITALKENELMAMKFSMDFMDMDYELKFSDAGSGKTKISTKSTTFGNGLFAKSMISFMPKSMKAQEEENLMNLKKLIDNNTKNYFPVPEPVLEIISNN